MYINEAIPLKTVPYIHIYIS